MKGTFLLVQKLSGYTKRCPKNIRLENGTVTSDMEQRTQRWLRHFCSVLDGRLTDDWGSLRTYPALGALHSDFNISPQRLLGAFDGMAIGKGLGPDCIPVQLLRAGASPLAIQMSELCGRMVCAESWPP